MIGDGPQGRDNVSATRQVERSLQALHPLALIANVANPSITGAQHDELRLLQRQVDDQLTRDEPVLDTIFS